MTNAPHTNTPTSEPPMQAEIPADAAEDEKSASDPMKAPLDGQLDEAGWLAACKAMAVNEKGTAIGYGSYRSPARAAITAYLAALPAPPGDTPAPDDENKRLRAALAEADRLNGELAQEMAEMDPFCPKCRSSKECINSLCPTRPTRSALEEELATAVEMNRRLVAESDALRAAAPPGDLVGADELSEWMKDANAANERLAKEADELREALRECLREMKRAPHYPALWNAAITRADAALASAERPGGDDG